MGLLAFLLAACSPVPPNPRMVLEQNAATIDATAQDLLEALNAAGLTDASAHGAIDGCQSEPAPGVAYRAGITVKVGDDLAAGFDALASQLDAAGWQATDAYRDVDIDPAKPIGRYTRDDITLDVKTGGFSVGEEQYGADEMDLGITIEDDCVRVPDSSYISKVEDLAKDIPPRG
ncbi:hypothetical protein [Microbacterium sp.]|uniref:hypothetical protein n=1 Tax=Microbacterium sp. TaxID=51671 RepID=UPI0028118F34|nr:hypothetical protein [Microbacterium sp.]